MACKNRFIMCSARRFNRNIIDETAQIEQFPTV